LRAQVPLQDHRRMQTIPRLVVAAAVLVAAMQAGAGEPAPQPPQRPLLQPPQVVVPSPITDRLAIRALYFRPTVINDLRYDDSDGNKGSLFGTGGDLGMQDVQNLGSLDLMFRMGPRHRIQAEFNRLNRKGDKALTFPLSFGDADFAAGERIVSRINLRTLGVTYLYSPLQRQTVELAMGLGIHLLQIDGTLEAPARFESEQVDTAGPFPSLVVDGTWRFTRRLSLNGTLHYLSVNTSKADGAYLSWRSNLQFRSARNLAFGLGFSATRFKADSTDPGRSGYLNLWYFGPEVFARASF
jgi:hypothetical protein